MPRRDGDRSHSKRKPDLNGVLGENGLGEDEALRPGIFQVAFNLFTAEVKSANPYSCVIVDGVTSPDHEST